MQISDQVLPFFVKYEEDLERKTISFSVERIKVSQVSINVDGGNFGNDG